MTNNRVLDTNDPLLVKKHIKQHTLFFIVLVLGLRMARIDPSRQGDMDGRQDKLGVWRTNLNISKKSKNIENPQNPPPTP